MNLTLLLIIAAPTIFWDKGVDTAAALKAAGISTIHVPPPSLEAWKREGLEAHALSTSELNQRAKLAHPGIDAQIATLSPTQRPFVVAHGWQFLRKPKGQYRYDPHVGSQALAVVETSVYNADAVISVDARELPAVGAMLSFFRRLNQVDLPDLSQIGVIDDGSESVAEVEELLSRRNLLFRPVTTRNPNHLLTIQLGTKEYPVKAASDPSEFAYSVRRKIGDDKRLLRIYGSETVLCRLVGSKARARLYLINYGGNPIEGLRVRLRGNFSKGAAFSDLNPPDGALRDYTLHKGVAEFSVPSFRMIGIVDLFAETP